MFINSIKGFLLYITKAKSWCMAEECLERKKKEEKNQPMNCTTGDYSGFDVVAIVVCPEKKSPSEIAMDYYYLLRGGSPSPPSLLCCAGALLNTSWWWRRWIDLAELEEPHWVRPAVFVVRPLCARRSLLLLFEFCSCSCYRWWSASTDSNWWGASESCQFSVSADALFFSLSV